MKEIWIKYGWLIVGIFVLLLLSIFCQMIVIYHMIRLVKESERLDEEMPKTLKAWIEEYWKEKSNITNVSVFLDKKMAQLNIGKYKVKQINHLSGQLLLGMIFLAGLGACKGIIDGMTLGQILPFYIISILGVYFHFSLSGLMDFAGKQKMIHTNLTDFLENGKPYLYMDTRLKEEREVESVKEFFGEEQDLELKQIIREILA